MEAIIQNQDRDVVQFEFWPGRENNIDVASIHRNAVSVKGQSYHNPLRFLEIYGNTKLDKVINAKTSSQSIEDLFFPKIPNVLVRLGPEYFQPPFLWLDCTAETLCGNFTYNTNAIYRILSNLAVHNKIPKTKISSLLDQACLFLTRIYRHQDHHVIRHINNNFNMYLITKVVEVMLGKAVYDAESQEPEVVKSLLDTALSLVKEHQHYSLKEKIGVAIGKGVSFLRQDQPKKECVQAQYQHINEVSNQYYGQQLAIDHRDIFLDKIFNAESKGAFTLAVVLDDVAESVDDFLWMQDLLQQCPHLSINVILNTAQVSINFSSDMIDRVLEVKEFSLLSKLKGDRWHITEIYCPLISFQKNYLQDHARKVINLADAVYVKGANFFETLQFKEKATFYGFVVYGPVSRTYTGLKDNDAVFAYVPRGQDAFMHHKDCNKIKKLIEIEIV